MTVQKITENLAPDTYYVSVKVTVGDDEISEYSDYGIVSIMD